MQVGSQGRLAEGAVAHGPDDLPGPDAVPGLYGDLRGQACVDGLAAVPVVQDHSAAQKVVHRDGLHRPGAGGADLRAFDVQALVGPPVCQGVVILQGVR